MYHFIIICEFNGSSVTPVLAGHVCSNKVSTGSRGCMLAIVFMDRYSRIYDIVSAAPNDKHIVLIL